MNGVTVTDSSNSLDQEAVLQVFRIANSDTIEVSLNSELTFDNYELYNICFVKNETAVQPNGKVTVKVPIPDGMNKNTCSILRQEANGGWTILDAKVDGNYLVFETDHFSLYAVTGNLITLKIKNMPNKTSYHCDDNIDLTGLALAYSDASGKEIVITNGFCCSPTVLTKTGSQTITVTYGLSSTQFKVNVTDESSDKFATVSIKTPSTDTIDYGDTLRLTAITADMPECAYVKWEVSGDGITITAQDKENGTCDAKATGNGTATVTAKVVDKDGNAIKGADGNEITASQTVKANGGFFQKIIAFFKSLFGLTKVIVQSTDI